MNIFINRRQGEFNQTVSRLNLHKYSKSIHAVNPSYYLAISTQTKRRIDQYVYAYGTVDMTIKDCYTINGFQFPPIEVRGGVKV